MTDMAREILFEAASQIEDAVSLLHSCYSEVTGLFNDYEAADSFVTRQTLAAQICTSLMISIQLEEDIFQPAAKRVLKEKGIISAVKMKQAILKYLVKEIEELDTDSAVYDIKIRVLHEHVKAHFQENERTLFPQAQKACGKFNLWGLGAQLVQRNQLRPKMCMC